MSSATIGALRRRLTLEQPVRGTDDGAAAALTWTGVADLWASVTSQSGREIVIGDGQAARITHAIEIRWRAGVTAAMRFRDGATVYDIRAVRDGDARRRRLVCLVEELAP